MCWNWWSGRGLGLRLFVSVVDLSGRVASMKTGYDRV